MTLAGTLTIPESNGLYPAMVLVTGSGPQDRDETLFGHKPFAVIADYLARRDIAVLRYDDRGTAKSTGRFLGATTADFALDAEGAINYLLKRPEFTKVGIGGHSEGAVIASMVAARRRDAAFVVMLAGTGVRGEELIYAQAAAIRHASGMTEEAIEMNRRALEILFPLARNGASEAEMLQERSGEARCESRRRARCQNTERSMAPGVRRLRSRAHAVEGEVSRARDERKSGSAGACRSKRAGDRSCFAEGRRSARHRKALPKAQPPFPNRNHGIARRVSPDRRDDSAGSAGDDGELATQRSQVDRSSRREFSCERRYSHQMASLGKQSI